MQPDRRWPKYAAVGLAAGFVIGAIGMLTVVWLDSGGFDRESWEGLAAFVSAVSGATAGAITGAALGGLCGALRDWQAHRQVSERPKPPQ
jgi:hypothetical protein